MGRASGPPWMVRTKKRQVAVLIVATAVMGYLTVRTAVVLAGLRPYFGAYWYLGLAAGAAVAIGVPVLSLWAMVRRGPSRWSFLLLVGYEMAVLAGMRLFSFARVRAMPLPSAPSPPPPHLFFELASVAFTVTGITELALLTVLGLVGLLVPAPFLRKRLHRQGQRRGRGSGPPVIPVRLRLPGHAEDRPWLRGNLHVAPGSLLWVPASGVRAAPMELIQATLVLAQQAARPNLGGKSPKFVTVDTQAGQVQLKLDPRLLEFAQRAAALMASASGPRT